MTAIPQAPPPATAAGRASPEVMAKLLADHLASRSRPLALADLVREVGLEDRPRSTIHAWLSLARSNGWVVSTGDRKGARWSASEELLRETLAKQLAQPLERRPRVTYQEDFLLEYEPNESFYLSGKQRQLLLERSAPGTASFQAMDKHDQSLFLCGLSFASSSLEGNPYDLAATVKLLIDNVEKEGASSSETQMVKNHHAAVSYLVRNITYPPLKNQVMVNEREIRALHRLLAEGLIDNPDECGRLRNAPVLVEHSAYIPAAVATTVAQAFAAVCKKARCINDPYEQAFFLLVHLPYLQPFVDCNKRTARVAVNIPLLRSGVIPMNWMDVAHRDLTEGILGVYERCNPALLAEVFTQGYVNSSERFRIMQSTRNPDAIVERYRSILRGYIRAVVLQGDASMDEVAPEDQSAFMVRVEQELAALRRMDAAALLRLRLREGDVLSWLTQMEEMDSGPVRERLVG